MKGIGLLHREELPEGVLISVQGVSKAPPLPLPMPPRWLARLLPGVQWSAGAGDRERDLEGDDSGDDDDDMDDYDPDERVGVAFKEFSFDVSAGEGLGLVGPDFQVSQALLFMITGFRPPSTGRILIRGRIAPVLKPGPLNIGSQMGKKAVTLIAKYLGWPPEMLRKPKWDEIVEFARLEEITKYPPGSVEYDNLVTRRLIQSAALHLDDATVYLVGHNFARADPPFSDRCFEILERRQQEGCAILQNALEVEEVSRLCQEAVYVEGGDPMFRGRLGEVASFALQRQAEEKKEGAKAIPVRALLLGEGVELGAHGGKIEIELDVFKRELDLQLAMLFIDEMGRETRAGRPEAFVAKEPGIYRLTINVPGGLLGYSSYTAKLLATGVDGESEEHSLLSFDFVSHGAGPGPSPDLDLDLDLEGVSDDVEVSDETSDVEWNVHRVGA
jgi:ABC-type polysaccharide/polyol phosphate transport system ATPase subunit